jgi:hypothetical protein
LRKKYETGKRQKRKEKKKIKNETGRIRLFSFRCLCRGNQLDLCQKWSISDYYIFTPFYLLKVEFVLNFSIVLCSGEKSILQKRGDIWNLKSEEGLIKLLQFCLHYSYFSYCLL